MAYRNKVYVAFDGDNDIKYFDLMKAWDKNPNFDFELHNAHDLESARDSSLESSIKASLLRRFKNSKCFVLLVGKHTRYLTKFVKWEIQTAIRLELPTIVVNLDNARKTDELLPSTLKNELLVAVPFEEKIIKYALDNWPVSDHIYRLKNEISNYYYPDSVYNSL